MQTQTQRQALNIQPPPVSEPSLNDERLLMLEQSLQALRSLPMQEPAALQYLYPQQQPRPQIYIDPWAARGFVGVCGLGVVMIGAVAIINSLPSAQQAAATRELLQQQQAAMEAIANKPATTTCIALICPAPQPQAPTTPVNDYSKPPYNGGQY